MILVNKEKLLNFIFQKPINGVFAYDENNVNFKELHYDRLNLFKRQVKENRSAIYILKYYKKVNARFIVTYEFKQHISIKFAKEYLEEYNYPYNIL
jgi:hypothetical protein